MRNAFTSKSSSSGFVAIAIVHLGLLGGCSGDGDAPSEETTASAEIGPQGGTLQTDDQSLVLEVPAGALEETTTLTARRLGDSDPNALSGTRYELGPDGTTFSQPVSLGHTRQHPSGLWFELDLPIGEPTLDGTEAFGLGLQVRLPMPHPAP